MLTGTLFFYALLSVGDPAWASSGDILQLAQDPVWKALLQLDGNSAQIQDPSFYLGSSFVSAEDELRETVTALSSSAAQTIACRFPARVFWLQQKLKLNPLEFQACRDLQEFLAKAPLDEASVVFASENISQPSSMLGHVFLKFKGRTAQGLEASHALSFFTEIRGWNFLKLAFDSIVVGKDGFYTLSPYEGPKNHYLFVENRNIWEYALKLDDTQKKLLHLHAYELKSISMTYFFTAFNCATLIRNMIGIAYPKVMDAGSFWVTPLDVVRAIERADAVEQKALVPVSAWKVEALRENLRSGRDRLSSIQMREYAKLDFDTVDRRDAFLLLELAQALNNSQLESEEVSLDEWRRGRAEIQRRKEDLGFQSETLDMSTYKSPSLIPDDSQLFMTSRWFNDDHSFVLGLLPVARQLRDDSAQYQNENELRLFEASIRIPSRSPTVELNSLILYSAASLRPTSYLTRGRSWLLRTGFEPLLTERMKEERSLFIAGGYGLTFRLTRDVDLYLMAATGARSRHSSTFAAGPLIGLIVREISNLKTIAELKQDFGFDGTGVLKMSLCQTWNAGPYSLGIDYVRGFRNLSGSDPRIQDSRNAADRLELLFKLFF